MRRIVIVGAVVGVGILLVRARVPKLHERLMARCEAGLSEPELDDAVATARTARREAVELLSARVDELLGRGGTTPEPATATPTSKARELVALGVSVGANSHPLLHLHVGAAHDVGLEVHQVRSALKMAGYVQQRAAEITADEVTRALAERIGSQGEPVAAN